MSAYTKEEALAFVEAMRVTLTGKTGFKWLVERLSDLTAYIESLAAENERLNAYLDWSESREDFASYCATSSDDPSSTPREGAD